MYTTTQQYNTHTYFNGSTRIGNARIANEDALGGIDGTGRLAETDCRNARELGNSRREEIGRMRQICYQYSYVPTVNHRLWAIV